MENISWKITKKNTFNLLSPLNSPKKNIRSEFFSFMKNTERTNSKKTNNFPLCLTLFIKSKPKNNIEANEIKNRFNSRNFKPKELNVNSFSFNDLIEKRKEMSRNIINSNNSSDLNINLFNTNEKINSFRKIAKPIIKFKNINYSPLNINTRSIPIIINQIGLDKKSFSKLNKKVNDKLSKFSNKSLDYNDISPIKNLKQNLFRNINKTKSNIIKGKRLPNFFVPLTKNKERKSFLKENIIFNSKLKDIKKLFYKDINKLKLEEKNNKVIKKDNKINKDTDNDKIIKNVINTTQEKLVIKEIKNNNDNNKLDNIINNNTNLKDNIIEQKEKEKDDNENNKKDKVSDVVTNNADEGSDKNLKNKNQRLSKFRKFGRLNSTFIKIINHYNNMKNENENKFYFLEHKKVNNKFLLKFEFTKNNKIINKITQEKIKLLLDMQSQIKKYNNNDLELLININDNYELKDKMKKDNNQKNIKNKMSKKYIRQNCCLTFSLKNYILKNYEFNGISPKNINKIKTRINLKSVKNLRERILEKEKEENMFKRTKTNLFDFHYNIISYNNDDDWILVTRNIIRINEIILKENKYDYNDNIRDNINNNNLGNFFYANKINNFVPSYKSKTLRRHSLMNNNFNGIINIYDKDSIQKNSEKFNLMLNNKKTFKSIKIFSSSSKFSVLYSKKFFYRNKKINKSKKINNKENKHLSSLNKYISSNKENQKECEKDYFILLNLINKGDNKKFIDTYKKLKHKLDINQQIYEGNTLIIYSAKEGNESIIKFLCLEGCDVNIQNNLGNTALHYAISNKFFSIVDILKNNGAKENILNNEGFSPWECIERNCE